MLTQSTLYMRLAGLGAILGSVLGNLVCLFALHAYPGFNILAIFIVMGFLASISIVGLALIAYSWFSANRQSRLLDTLEMPLVDSKLIDIIVRLEDAGDFQSAAIVRKQWENLQTGVVEPLERLENQVAKSQTDQYPDSI